VARFSILGLLVLIALCVAVAALVAAVVYLAGRWATSSREGNPNLRPCPDCGKHISIGAEISTPRWPRGDDAIRVTGWRSAYYGTCSEQDDFHAFSRLVLT
jgi:hypothetical protein